MKISAQEAMMFGGPKAAAVCVGRIEKVVSLQAVAATLAASVIWVADFKGKISDAQFVSAVTPAAGESMVLSVLKNGVTMMSANVTVDNTVAAKKKWDIWANLDKAKNFFNEGDIITFTRTYVPGGTPAMTATNLVLEMVAEDINAARAI